MKLMIKGDFDNDYMNEEYDIFNNEDIEYESEDYDPEVAKAFEKDIRKFLDYVISLSDTLSEDFTSRQNLNNYFYKHCIGHRPNRHSEKGRIYYDFTKISDYVDYERKVSKEIKETYYIISSLHDYDLVLRYMRKLFRGNITIMFATDCGINNNGSVSLSFHAYSSDVTTNYGSGNTIDICIKNENKRTVSLYAVDAHDVERRLNNTLASYSDYEGRFGINVN